MTEDEVLDPIEDEYNQYIGAWGYDEFPDD